LKSSLKVSFQLSKVIEAEMEQSRPFTLSSVGALSGAWKEDFGMWSSGVENRTLMLGWPQSELVRSLLLATPIRCTAEGRSFSG
jgi:hypothetical protein